MDCEPGQGEPGHPSVPSAESDSRAGPLGPCVEPQDCTCWCHPAQYVWSWARLSLTSPPLCPAVPELQDHLPTAMPASTSASAWTSTATAWPTWRPSTTLWGCMGWGQVGGGAVRSPLLGCGALSLGEGTHCLSLPTLMFPPGVCSPSLSLCLVSLFTYLFFACTGP